MTMRTATTLGVLLVLSGVPADSQAIGPVTGGVVGAVVGMGSEVGAVLGAGVLILVYDPLAPNWSIEERALNELAYHFSLRAKSFRVGGDGEAMQVFKRRAQQLVVEGGFTGYKILDYSEGISSSTPLTNRYAEGTIELVRSEAAEKLQPAVGAVK